MVGSLLGSLLGSIWEHSQSTLELPWTENCKAREAYSNLLGVNRTLRIELRCPDGHFFFASSCLGGNREAKSISTFSSCQLLHSPSSSYPPPTSTENRKSYSTGIPPPKASLEASFSLSFPSRSGNPSYPMYPSCPTYPSNPAQPT